MSNQNMPLGGQAVIEGVMMRSQDTLSVAVRRKNGSIYVRKLPFVSLVKKFKVFSLPILRGAVVLIESLILGVKALAFSGDVAMEDEKTKEGKNSRESKAATKKSFASKVWTAATVLFSLTLGLFIFFYVPLILTDLLGARSGFMFNLVDGILRLGLFLMYLGLITLMKDIRRIFEYHGAEHKSIHTFENKRRLIPSEAQVFSRFHPRCGTSFLLIVMIVSIFVFMFLGKPHDLGDRLFRLAFIPLIGGLSYEMIRLSDNRANSNFWKAFILPGLWLQKLTTKEPDESQLEVAIIALRCALGEDLSEHKGVVLEGQEFVQADVVS
ncbi:MAG: DUF1385 domain-containing protein [bacterium]